MKHLLVTIFLTQSLFSSIGVTITPANKMMHAHKKPVNIEQVSSNGGLITLSNGKKYVVHEDGRRYSSGWLLPSKIKLYKTKDPQVFIMKNLATNTSVHVRPY